MLLQEINLPDPVVCLPGVQLPGTVRLSPVMLPSKSSMYAVPSEPIAFECPGIKLANSPDSAKCDGFFV